MHEEGLLGISAGYLLFAGAGQASLVLIIRVLAQDLISSGFSALSDGGWK